MSTSSAKEELEDEVLEDELLRLDMLLDFFINDSGAIELVPEEDRVDDEEDVAELELLDVQQQSVLVAIFPPTKRILPLWSIIGIINLRRYKSSFLRFQIRE